MTYILHIETSEEICSVALSDGSKLIASKTSTGERSHAAMLTVLIKELLSETDVSSSKLTAICVSKGPGSYTGLRIGVSVAKGLSYGLSIPLVSVHTLQALAYGAIHSAQYRQLTLEKQIKPLFCSMIDARRMEVYKGLFNESCESLGEITADIVESETYRSLLDDNYVVFFGSGADKLQQTIVHKNAFFLPSIRPNAEFLVVLGNQAYEKKHFEDVAYFEPFYLKDFVATTAKKKVF